MGKSSDSALLPPLPLCPVPKATSSSVGSLPPQATSTVLRTVLNAAHSAARRTRGAVNGRLRSQPSIDASERTSIDALPRQIGLATLVLPAWRAALKLLIIQRLRPT